MKKVAHSIKKGGSLRTVLGGGLEIFGPSQTLQDLLLVFAKVSGHKNIDKNDKVSTSVGVHCREALAFEP